MLHVYFVFFSLKKLKQLFETKGKVKLDKNKIIRRGKRVEKMMKRREIERETETRMQVTCEM